MDDEEYTYTNVDRKSWERSLSLTREEMAAFDRFMAKGKRRKGIRSAISRKLREFVGAIIGRSF